MKKTLSLPGLLLLPLLLCCGCATTVTNLTPSTQTRHADGLYPFEVMLDTSQRSLRKETLTPYVMIGSQLFPMQPTPMVNNRWETLVPISGDKEYVNYRYKFNYEYNGIPSRGRGSKLSPPYQLQIVDRER